MRGSVEGKLTFASGLVLPAKISFADRNPAPWNAFSAKLISFFHRIVPNTKKFVVFDAAGGTRDALLTGHAEYLALASDEYSRHRAYAALFEREDESEFLAAVRQATSGGYPLAGAILKSQLATTGARLQRRKPGPKVEKSAEQNPASADLGF